MTGRRCVHFTTGTGEDLARHAVRARLVIGADGACSPVGRAEVPGHAKMRQVFAYHEILRVPEPGAPGADSVDATRCDVYYQGRHSPDFYSWIFPHGDTLSIGTGSARKGFSLRSSIRDLRAATGLDGAETLRREGAPLPLKPLKRWDNGRDVLLAGDAAGVVAPASGEGIYYAMLGGRLSAEAAAAFLRDRRGPRPRAARAARFMKLHGRVFWILGMMQWVWYRSDGLRERFVVDLPGQGRAAAHLGQLHEQGAGPGEARRPRADLLQGPRAPVPLGLAVTLSLTGAGWGPPAVRGRGRVLVAVAGGVATTTDAWYRRLRVPAWKPPDWAFGPVWTVIFAAHRRPPGCSPGPATPIPAPAGCCSPPTR